MKNLSHTQIQILRNKATKAFKNEDRLFLKKKGFYWRKIGIKLMNQIYFSEMKEEFEHGLGDYLE